MDVESKNGLYSLVDHIIEDIYKQATFIPYITNLSMKESYMVSGSTLFISLRSSAHFIS